MWLGSRPYPFYQMTQDCHPSWHDTRVIFPHKFSISGISWRREWGNRWAASRLSQRWPSLRNLRLKKAGGTGQGDMPPNTRQAFSLLAKGIFFFLWTWSHYPRCHVPHAKISTNISSILKVLCISIAQPFVSVYAGVWWLGHNQLLITWWN